MENPAMKRTDSWLEERMYNIWENHFADIPRKNHVIIKYGRSSIRQLGSIKWAQNNTRIKSLIQKKDVRELVETQDDRRITVITITRKFQDLSVPQYVIESTIAHELVHYAHGFSSPLARQHKHPHKGGLIRKELEKRGMGTIHRNARKWIREHWQTYQ